MPYDFDPEIAPLVAAMPQFEATDVVQARELFTAFIALQEPYEPPIPMTILDTVVQGVGGGRAVALRVYTPADLGDDPLPGTLYLHGGGFTVGDLDTEHSAAARVAAEAGTIVVSVDYRLAPEHPYPAGLEDCYAALVWMAALGDDLGVDPDRLAVRGASAGGGLGSPGPPPPAGPVAAHRRRRRGRRVGRSHPRTDRRVASDHGDAAAVGRGGVSARP